MLKLKKIAITGGIASGKSTVCGFFKDLGACVVSADEVGHGLLDPATSLGQQIIRQFGPEIVENGTVSRVLLAEKAFRDQKSLKKLEGLLHLPILQRIEELYKKASREGAYTSFVVEMPLLFEIGAEDFYDITVTVLADENEAMRRFEEAGFEKNQYTVRMSRQIQPEKKAVKSNYIIQNNGSIEALRQEVLQLDRTIHQQ